jgi:2-polyprenyl-3-methyl-5-hydroxy-6-metoxy-1,4-benzoquinol methylase
MVASTSFNAKRMNPARHSNPQSAPSVTSQLLETQSAFDSVAADYDGPRGNNESIQEMRVEMWRWLEKTFSPDSRLLDLGCGTGLDAVHLAERGYRVTATDWSPLMVQRTQRRAADHRVTERVSAINVGAQELRKLDEAGAYEGAYSNLGPLNCVPDLSDVSRACAQLLKPGGALVFTVIGRCCPWEIAHYLRLGRWSRAMVRFARNTVPVGMNKHTIWTQYYTPREFYRPFEPHFRLEHYRGLCVLAPPPYLTGIREKHSKWFARLWNLDRRVASWPLMRAIGDHFLMVMRKR